jgi:serine/threonine protein kinase
MEGDSQHNDSCPTEFLLPDSLDQWPPFDELLRRGTVLRKATSWGNTDTYILRTCNGTEFLLKTFSRQPFFIRALLGRVSIRKEYNTLIFLREKGFWHAPEAVALLNSNSLLMEYISDASQLVKSERYSDAERPSPQFFQRLISMIRDLHRIGIAHGDFRRANILRLPGDIPILIDWATAIIKYPEQKKFSLSRYFFNVVRKSDLYSLASITESYYPELLDDELNHYLNKQPWFLRVGCFLRQRFYRHFIKQLTGRKKQSSNVS